jgi:hypothetical protein
VRSSSGPTTDQMPLHGGGMVPAGGTACTMRTCLRQPRDVSRLTRAQSDNLEVYTRGLNRSYITMGNYLIWKRAGESQ